MNGLVIQDKPMVKESDKTALKEFLGSAKDMVGTGQPEGPLQKIARGYVDLKTLTSLPLGLNDEQKERIGAYLHLVRLALRHDKTIFESHLRSYGSSLENMTFEQKNWYEKELKKWDQIELKAKEYISSPYPALKKWMDKLGITKEVLEKPLLNPAFIADDRYIISEILLRMDKLKLFALKASEEYGGLSFSHKEYDATLREMAKVGSGSLMTLVSVMGTIAYAPVGMFGTEEQKKKFLGKQAAFALTEPSSGSDAIGSMLSIAEETSDNNYYEITGQKIYITNAHRAELLYLGAKVKEIDKVTGETKLKPTVFIVELDPSFSLSDSIEDRNKKLKELEKKGIKLSHPLLLNTIPGTNQAHITLTKFKVPKKNILGKVGDGAGILFGSLNPGRAAFASSSCEAALQLFAQIRYWCQMRKLNMFKMFDPDGGGRLGCHPFVQVEHIAPVACMAIGMDATSELVAAIFDELGKKINIRAESALVKALASETLIKVSHSAHTLHGGYAYMEGHLNQIERARCDAEITATVEGQNDLMTQYGTGVAVDGIKNDGENVQRHVFWLWKKLITCFGLFERKDESKKKRRFQFDLFGSLLPSIGRLIYGFLNFECGSLSYFEAFSLQIRAKKLSFKIMLLGMKYGQDMIKKPVELQRMGNALKGILSLTAAYNKLSKEGKNLPYPVKASLERFIELKLKEVDLTLKEIKIRNIEDEKNKKVAKAWMEFDEQDLENRDPLRVVECKSDSYKISSPYEY